MKKIALLLITNLTLLFATTLNRDVNGDGLKDKVTYEFKDLHQYPNLNEPTISFKIKTQKQEYRFDTYCVVAPTVTITKGCITIVQVRGGNSGVNIEESYCFDRERNHWFLSEQIEDGETSLIKNPTQRIDYLFQPKFTLKEFLAQCKKGNKKVMDDVRNDYIDYYLKAYPLADGSVISYNNIAYYLQKAGKNREAVYLLKKIVSKFYYRAVAYYNLGDAYWALGKKEKALYAYRYYVTLMRKEGKEKIVPSKILKRTHEKRIASYMGKSEKFLKLEYGDLNRDGIDDAVLVTEKKNGNRPLYLLVGTKKGAYKIYGKNENIVYRAEDGGARGDPFYGITIKNGYFSIEHEGGSREMWTVIITFKYDSKKRKFFLHKEGGSDADTRSSDGFVEVIERKVETVKDFGVVPFEKYNNHMNEEYRLK